jgi:ribonuclease Z
MLGLTGLLRTLGLQDRSAPVLLYGPKGAQRVLGAAMLLGIERNKFPVEILEVKPGDRLSRDGYDIAVFETEHRADTVGYALAEHPRLGRFNPARARELGIPEGPLWGELHRGRVVTLPDGRTVDPADLVGAPRRGRVLVYTGDTRPHRPVIEAARDADVLVHEATFGGDEQERAKETGHSTAAEAARVAAEAGAHRLVLTHISSRYNRDTSELLAEARAVFPETVIARDGMTVEVPYADADQ